MLVFASVSAAPGTESDEAELAAAAEKAEALERKKRKARRRIDETEDAADESRTKILAALKKKMVQEVKRETLFTVRWTVI